MSVTTSFVVLSFVLLAAVPANAGYGCGFFKIAKGYLEASGGAAGNIACKKWPSLDAAKAECRATRACDGFSFGPWAGGVGGCLKKNRSAGYNGNVRYAGYHKTCMGCCAGDTAPSGQCFPTGGKNQSLKKPVMQSSVNYGGIPSRAVDGNTNPNWSGKSCTHTKNEVNPWWVVNLGASTVVSRVVITNRADCCSERLSNFSIKIGDNYKFLLNPACVTGAKQGKGTKPWPCNLKGQFVAIEIPARATLTLCEVQVWGYVPGANGDLVEQNLTDGAVFDESTTFDEKSTPSAYERAVWSDAALFAQ